MRERARRPHVTRLSAIIPRHLRPFKVHEILPLKALLQPQNAYTLNVINLHCDSLAVEILLMSGM